MTTTVQTIENLEAAEGGSYYTILGAGGNLADWVEGYEKIMKAEGVGLPKAWYTTTGQAVNEYAQPEQVQDAFDPNLTILMFPLDDLDVGRLAIFKLQMGDRWFDDMVDNMSPAPLSEDDDS